MLRGVVHAAAVIAVAFTLAFLLLHAQPGDPLDRLDSSAVPAAQAARTRQALGLDAPLPVQLARTIGSYACGDLGTSLRARRPVLDVIRAALPATAALGAAALAIAYGVGILLALLLLALPARIRRIGDALALVASTLPRFWVAVLLVLVLHTWAGWLPASHAAPVGAPGLSMRHLVLPALALGLPAAAVVARYVLEAMVRAARSPHVQTARASGLARRTVLVRHVLRPSLGVAAALLALDVQVLVSGALVVEVVFSWPGVGRVAADAVLSSDYPVALACALLAALAVVTGRALAEALARRIDPRVTAS